MNIFVCVKPVPDPDKYDLLKIDEKTKRLVREGIPTVINPSDKNALEEALKIKEQLGGKVIVIGMTPLFSVDRLEMCLAMGADEAIVVSDKAFGGADTLATSYTLAKAIEKTGVKPDLILAGNESADGATSHVPTQLAEWMNLSHLTNVKINKVDESGLAVSKKTEKGCINYKVKFPVVLAVEKNSNQPRYVTASGVESYDTKPVNVYTRENLDVDDKLIGLDGSPTKSGELFVPEMNRNSEELTGDPKSIAQKIVSLIKKAGVAGSSKIGGK